jgi:hypothetical protein
MKKLIGILLIIISAASFGTLAIFGRYLYQEQAGRRLERLSSSQP